MTHRPPRQRSPGPRTPPDPAPAGASRQPAASTGTGDGTGRRTRPRTRGEALERHWSRARGTEPVTARSALRIRLVLASVFTPFFAAGTALFWYWMTQSGPGDVPDAGSLRTLTVICGALTLFSLVDLTVVLLRRRRERTRRPPAGALPPDEDGWHD